MEGQTQGELHDFVERLLNAFDRGVLAEGNRDTLVAELTGRTAANVREIRDEQILQR